MKITQTKFDGLRILELNHHEDNRGYFARYYCEETFKKLSLPEKLPQTNISYSIKKGTIRGMHYQVNGYEECKIISCINGSIYDVVIDLRENSSTYLKTYSINLNQDDNIRFVIPEGFAHGFQSLSDNATVIYQVSKEFSPGNERGIRYNDPFFNIKWPLEISSISKKDLELQDFNI